MNPLTPGEMATLRALLDALRAHVAELPIQRWSKDVTLMGQTAKSAAITALFAQLTPEEIDALLDLGERDGALLRVGQRLYLRPAGDQMTGKFVDITKAYKSAPAGRVAPGDASGAEPLTPGPTTRVGRRMSAPLPSPQRVARSLDTVSTQEPRPPSPSGRGRRSHTALSQGDLLAQRRRQRETIAAKGRAASNPGRPRAAKIRPPEPEEGPDALKDDALLRALEERLERQSQRAQEERDDRLF